tara:strand:+ start:615 stop:785 length:171 start_codon:yes stop_codon:yes gene_type:complete
MTIIEQLEKLIEHYKLEAKDFKMLARAGSTQYQRLLHQQNIVITDLEKILKKEVEQ